MPQRLNLHGNQPAPVLLPRALARALAEREGAQAHRTPTNIAPPLCPSRDLHGLGSTAIAAGADCRTRAGAHHSRYFIFAQSCTGLLLPSPTLLFLSLFCVQIEGTGHDLNENYVQFGNKRPKFVHQPPYKRKMLQAKNENTYKCKKLKFY